MVGLNHQQCKTISTERFRLSPSSEFTGTRKNSKFHISTGKSRKKQNNHENVSQCTIQIHIKRPKKLKNGRLTKQNCYTAAVSRPQFEFEIANGRQNEKNRIMRFVAVYLWLYTYILYTGHSAMMQNSP